MITRQDLEIKNPWWKGDNYQVFEQSLPKRELYSTILNNLGHTLILNIVGLRRVGKSTILKQLIGQLLNQGLNPQNIFYYLFDYSSQIQKAKFLDEVLSFYFKEFIDKPALTFKEDETIYVFLDEIQYIEDWQSVVKRYYDLSNKRIKFIITGSQSVLLQGKHRESLAGRVFDYYLPPLSFREFLLINQESVETVEPYDLFQLAENFGKLSQAELYNGQRIAQLSREYIINGQFPEIRKFELVSNRHEYIAESVIGKMQEDCIRIFKIEKTDEFKLVTRHLLNNVGSVFELANIGREIALSRKTLEKYLQYLKDNYFFEMLYRQHKSLTKRGRILKKIYTPCVNFVCALNQYQESHLDQVPQAFGKVIENLVYNILQMKYKGTNINESISFWRQGQKEIDFIVIGQSKNLAIEVKFSNQINFKDLLVMTDYMKNKSLEYGIVVTKKEIGKREVNGQLLYYIPYHLFLLSI